MEKIILKVDGMVCSGCENRIQNALKSLNGVENVVADYNTKTVTITLNEMIEKDILKERIEDLGFEIKEY